MLCDSTWTFARSQGTNSPSSQMRRFGNPVGSEFVTAETVSQPRGCSLSRSECEFRDFLRNPATHGIDSSTPYYRGRPNMRTGIRKGIDIIRLATGLYREMAASALSLIPTARVHFAG